jgi:hypothetical protein
LLPALHDVERSSPDRGRQASETGTELDAANLRRGLRRIANAAGLNADDWTPRELRHSFVSLLPEGGLGIEQIPRLVGHRNTTVTETVYRRQLSPVVEDGATAMDRLFPVHGRSNSVGYSPVPRTAERPGLELCYKLLTRPFAGGRYWDRTSDLFGVNEALSP